MPFSPFIEQGTQLVTGTFTSSLSNTTEFDRFRQGVESLPVSHPRYAYGVGGRAASNTIDTSSPVFPQDKYPRKYFTEDISDATEPYGFWYDGFIEPLTIRDEVAFTSIESPYLAHSVRGHIFEGATLVEQEELNGPYLNV